MKKINSILLVLICFTLNNYAQNRIEDSFISLKEKYEFNLPQFDLSIRLPANSGFRIRGVSDEKTMLDIDTETIYCFDLTRLGKDNKAGHIVFSVPDCGDDYLSMQIFEMPIAEFYKRKKVLAQQDKYKLLPTLKMKLGIETFSFSDGTFDFHFFHREGFLFCFSMPDKTSSKIKKQYQDIISGVQSKDLRMARTKYENRIKNGYYEKKDDDTEDDDKRYKFADWEGRITNPTTIDWELFGIKATIPGNMKYRVTCEQIVKSDDGTSIRIVMDSLNLYYNSIMISSFMSDEMSFTIRSYTKAANFNIGEIIKKDAEMTKYSTTKTIQVDGIALPATFYGTKEIGNIDLYYEANGLTHWLSFSGITSKTLPLADKLFASIRINQPQLKTKLSKNSCTTLSQCFVLKEVSDVPLDAPLAVPNISNVNIISCNLPNIGMKLGLLGPESAWLCSVGNNIVEMKNGIVEAVPLNNSDKRLSIYSSLSEGVYYNISKLDEDSSTDMKTYTENLKRSFSSYNEMNVKHASVTIINDRPWSMLIYKQAERYIGMFTAVCPGYEMSIVATGTSYDEIMEKSGYVRLVEFPSK